MPRGIDVPEMGLLRVANEVKITVLIELGIEKKVDDISIYYTRSHQYCTSYTKVYKETQLLRNVRSIDFYNQGLIQSNNVRRVKEYDPFTGQGSKDGPTFIGGILADPLMNDYCGIEIMGKLSNNIFDNAGDYDMGAYYPSLKIAMNKDGSTVLYKASVIPTEFQSGEFSNRSLNQEYTYVDKNGKTCSLDITGEFIAPFMTGNIMTAMYNCCSLPSISEIDQALKRSM